MTRTYAQILGVVVVGFLAMEVAARTEDRVRYGTEWFSPYREQGEMVVRDADGVHGRRGARFQKWGMNDLGFRGPEVDSTPPPRTLRVVTAGASETFGLYESAGQEYPRQLQDSLTAALPRLACTGDDRVEVLNAAMPGMTLPTVVQDIRLRLPRFAPSVVVYYPTPSQYLSDPAPTAARPDSSAVGPYRPDWRRRLYPRVFDRLREQVKGLLPGWVQGNLRARMIARTVASHEEGWRFDQIPQDRLDAFEADLRSLVGVVRAAGAVPVLATHANAFPFGEPPNARLLGTWERFFPRATGEVILAFDAAAAERTRTVAHDSATGLADLSSAIPPSGFADNVHFTDAGASQAAGLMAAAVLEAVTRHDCSGVTPR